MLLLQQMIVLFIFMGIGFYCGKKGFISDSSAKTLSFIVVNIANPAMIINAGLSDEASIQGKELAFMFLLAIGVFAFLILLGYIIPPILRVPAEDIGPYKVMIIFNNIGFMGFPILQAAYGPQSLLYASLFLFPFNILIYTYGIACMRKNSQEKESFDLSKAVNVGTIACAVSLIIYIFGIPVPDFLKTTASSLSGLTGPLSMMVIGQSMINMKAKEMFGDIRLFIFSLIKLVAVPVVGIMILKLFITDELILNVCYIMLATPVASMAAMLAQQYDGDYKLASKGVALTTILSVITIPLVSLLIF